MRVRAEVSCCLFFWYQLECESFLTKLILIHSHYTNIRNLLGRVRSCAKDIELVRES